MALSAIGLLFVAIFMWQDSHEVPVLNHELPMRPVSPFKSYISGVGIVEASSENIFIGAPVSRIVDKVEVKAGQQVKAGQILFRLEARDLAADLQARRIAFDNTLANFQKLEALPRSEDVSVGAALLKSAEIALAEAKSQFTRVDGLQKSGAMSDEEVSRRYFAYQEAEARFDKAKADFEKIKAGAWPPDLEIAKLQVEQALAEMHRVEANIQRTIITSPIDATVLQIKIHEGEFPPSRTPPMIIGNTDTLNLRVNINQFDASQFSEDASAVAFLQGNAEQNFALKFVKLEPYFVTKQNLNNDINEKVDTRVLQAIYAFKERQKHIYVGQQMDVFIETSNAKAP